MAQVKVYQAPIGNHDSNATRHLPVHSESQMMTMSHEEFLRLLTEARFSATRLHNLKIEHWLWENFCFDDHGAVQINSVMFNSFKLTEQIDLKLYRQFHGGEYLQ